MRAALPLRPALRDVPSGRPFTGLASWYGGAFDGRRTASGERFRADALTAASRTLPFGTRLRVCRLQRCVVVRVNDRGPQLHSRVLDLSRGARRALGFSGVARVTATPVRAAPAPVPRARPHRRAVAGGRPTAVPAVTDVPPVVRRSTQPVGVMGLLAVGLVGTAGAGLDGRRRGLGHPLALG